MIAALRSPSLPGNGRGRIRLWAPGSAAQLAASEGLVEVPAAVLNETGVLGIRASAAPGPFWQKQPSQQPFVGIIDCGASFTTVNTQVCALQQDCAGIERQFIKDCTAALLWLQSLHLAGSACQLQAGRATGLVCRQVWVQFQIILPRRPRPSFEPQVVGMLQLCRLQG